MAKRDTESRQLNKAAAAVPATGLRVISNEANQLEEIIVQSDMNCEVEVSGPRVRTNTPQQKEEPIALRESFDDAHPRIASGARVRENRAFQRVQKISRAALTVPTEDEIGFKKLFTRFEEAFVTQDIAALRTCLSPAFQWHLPNGVVVYGRDEALAEMERRFAMPNGPKFSASVWRFQGTTVLQTYEVEYRGPDGRWRASKGFDVYEIGGGLITRKDAYWKMIP